MGKRKKDDSSLSFAPGVTIVLLLLVATLAISFVSRNMQVEGTVYKIALVFPIFCFLSVIPTEGYPIGLVSGSALFHLSQ